MLSNSIRSALVNSSISRPSTVTPPGSTSSKYPLTGALAHAVLGCDVRTAEYALLRERTAYVALHPSHGLIQRVHDHRGSRVLRYAVCRRRIRHGNMLTDSFEVRLYVLQSPACRPGAIEHERRVRLEKHAVEHGIAAESDALIRERRICELVGGRLAA